jgi:hypothetical protein
MLDRWTFARWTAYAAVLPVCAGISYAADDRVAWFMTGLYGLALAGTLPLLAWSYFRARGLDGLRGD